MSAFLSMPYDSDSDSEEDLDFEPVSEASDGSESDSQAEEDEVMEDITDDVSGEHDSTPTTASTSKPAKATRKKRVDTAAGSGLSAALSDPKVTAGEGEGETAAITATATATATTTTISSTTTTTTITPPPATMTITGPTGAAEVSLVAAAVPAAESGDVANLPVPGEVVKKKKGPKKGTKYKKRTPAPDGSKPAPKAKKLTKKAAAAAAAEAEASQSQPIAPPVTDRFSFQNTQIDTDHPLETFRWPYSPFTAEFKSQHRARDKMAADLRHAVQEMTESNGRATWRLQELDHQLQASRQDLKTSLDEIQFRKSQLRDMSILAVDIVRKLSSPRPRATSLPRISPSSSSGAASGTESGSGGGGTGVYASSYHMSSSHLDSDRMNMDVDVDSAESAGEQYPTIRPHQRDPNALKGLNEGNVRSFLEKIRELERARHHVTV
ncbi:hypothetical protein BGZ99_005201 [Dissophora globulifera]|uniref:Uncharacterized protein n=1 Tax=Dissophora globulifera TaxID=979702 RepID=A0A9P6RKI2_9FUNG|nr:hypothetical protein BGZ99_005201 [Dissophora globulifera]